MVALTRQVSTPQVFFNASHIGGSCQSVLQVFFEWRHRYGSIEKGWIRDVYEQTDPLDSKLRVPPRIRRTPSCAKVVQKKGGSDYFEPTLLELPNGERMTLVTLTRQLIVKLPRKTITTADNRTFVRCFYGMEGIEVWKQWLQLSTDKEALEFGTFLIQNQILCVLSSSKKPFHPESVYRLQALDRPEALNTFCKVPFKPQDPTLLMFELCHLIEDIFEEHKNQKDTTSSKIACSEAYLIFQEAVAHLQHVPWSSFTSSSHRMAFEMNLHNLMVRHALIEFNEDQNACWQGVLAQMRYQLRGQTVSLADLQQGMLYSEEEPVKSRIKAFACLFSGCMQDISSVTVAPDSLRDPRLFFCLSWGTKSSPPIRIYHPSRLDFEITEATKSFCQKTIQIEHDKVVMPQWIAWHFQGSNCLENLVHYLSPDQCSDLQALHACQGKDFETLYEEFDWTRTMVINKTPEPPSRKFRKKLLDSSSASRRKFRNSRRGASTTPSLVRKNSHLSLEDLYRSGKNLDSPMRATTPSTADSNSIASEGFADDEFSMFSSPDDFTKFSLPFSLGGNGSSFLPFVKK